MTREHRFETVEHTADVGVVGIGNNMAEAFENCAYGMFAQMADLDKYKPDTHKRVVAVGLENVELLQRFLSALLVLFDAEGLLPIDIEITGRNLPPDVGGRVRRRVAGEGHIRRVRSEAYGADSAAEADSAVYRAAHTNPRLSSDRARDRPGSKPEFELDRARPSSRS